MQPKRVGIGVVWTAEETERARVAYLAGGIESVCAEFPERTRDAIASKVRQQRLGPNHAQWQRSRPAVAIAPTADRALPRFDSHAMLAQIALTPRRRPQRAGMRFSSAEIRDTETAIVWLMRQRERSGASVPSSCEIADELGMSVETVRRYQRRLSERGVLVQPYAGKPYQLAAR